MKKLFIVLSMVALMSSCGLNQTSNDSTTDSTVVDTTLVDSMSVDTTVVDSMNTDTTIVK